MILYSYFRSSASYRVRLALALKGMTPDETRYVNLREGVQREAEYLEVNPQGLVPAIVLESGTVITQSSAIIEYLDEAYPDTPALLPGDVLGRARVRSLAHSIACEQQPFVNLRVQNFLTHEMQLSDAQRKAWLQHWFTLGLSALEAQLAESLNTGTFCHGDYPTMADCFLVPQVMGAIRFEHDMAPYPTIRRINDAMLALPQIQQAMPANQPDAVA